MRACLGLSRKDRSQSQSGDSRPTRRKPEIIQNPASLSVAGVPASIPSSSRVANGSVNLSATRRENGRPAPQDPRLAHSSPQAVPRVRSPPRDVQRPAQGTSNSGADHSDNLWTAAYSAAFAQLSQEERDLVGQNFDIEALFNNLSETNDEHKKHSIIRRGIDKLNIPATYVNAILKLAGPAAGVNPIASMAVGLVQGVFTAALGVCGVEERLKNHISQMLDHISIIGECDALGEKFESSYIHKALVTVYKDLFKFYCTVTQMLLKKRVARAWISEQFNQRIPPIVTDFVSHASQLQTHISNATSETIKEIESMLVEDKIRNVLGVEKLVTLDNFHSELTQGTATDSCHWVTESSTFTTWYASPAQQPPLLLFGDMGSGKTTTMAFMVEHVRLASTLQIPRPHVCHHYCRDGETSQPSYIHASLAQQLMRQVPMLKVCFGKWQKEQGEEEKHHTADSTEDKLRRFFFACVQVLGNKTVFVFVDGLDQCNDEVKEKLVSDMKEKSRLMPGLRVCFSSRPYKEIRDLVHTSLEIRIRADRARDRAIVSYHAQRRLKFLDPQSRDQVIDRMADLANGSAIWATKAVDLLATEGYSAPAKLHNFLNIELPRFTLSDLYAKLYIQVVGNSWNNSKLLSAALEVLAVSARAMSLAELSWAATLVEEGEVTTVKELGRFVDSRRLLSLLTPFIGSVDYRNMKARQVHVVHQSVREMILQRAPCKWKVSNAKKAPQQPPTSTAAGERRRRIQMHHNLMIHCMRYLLMGDIGHLKLLSDEQDRVRIFEQDLPGMIYDEDETDQAGEADERPLVCDPSERGFGELFTYASCYWLYHMREAQDHARPDISQVMTLTTAGNLRADNWWDQFHRPDLIFLRGNDPPPLRPLSIVAVHGPESLLRAVLQRIEKSTTRQEALKHRQNAVRAILQQRGDLTRLPVLIPCQPGQDFDHTMQLFHEIVRTWSPKQTPEVQSQYGLVFDYMTAPAAVDMMVQQGWGNELLCTAAGNGCIPLASRLFKVASKNKAFKKELLRTPDRNHPGTAYHQSVGDAAWGGHGDMIAYLLQQDGIDAHLRYRDNEGNNVFHRATRGCSPAQIRLLLERFPEGSGETNAQGETPLRLVVFGRRPRAEDLAEVLLEGGHADVRCGRVKGESSSWEEPLRMAVRYGDVRMCSVLVRKGGADPMSVFRRGSRGSLEFIDRLDNAELGNRVRGCLLSLEEERKARRG